MFFGCEVWGNLNNVEYELFEKAQRKVAKHLQGITVRTHNEVALGLLGWHTIQGIIDKCKCMFLCKLIHMNDCLTKRVFIHELYKYCMTRQPLCTVTTDLIRVLHKYGVYTYLHKYVVGGVFPNKKIWKQMVKHNINSNQQEIWSRGLLIKGATRFLRVYPNFVVHPLYQCLKRNMPLRNSIMNIGPPPPPILLEC